MPGLVGGDSWFVPRLGGDGFVIVGFKDDKVISLMLPRPGYPEGGSTWFFCRGFPSLSWGVPVLWRWRLAMRPLIICYG